jgi:hypothetical protein
MRKREWYYVITIFVIAAIAATTFAIWTVYHLPRNVVDYTRKPAYPSFPYFPDIPKGLKLDDDHHNRP